MYGRLALKGLATIFSPVLHKYQCHGDKWGFIHFVSAVVTVHSFQPVDCAILNACPLNPLKCPYNISTGKLIVTSRWTHIVQVRPNTAAACYHWTTASCKYLCCVCGLERGIEHHELVCQVYNMWTPADEGRFYFRKDFAKYELFRNPTVSIVTSAHIPCCPTLHLGMGKPGSCSEASTTTDLHIFHDKNCTV